jgi:hypothetical protein
MSFGLFTQNQNPDFGIYAQSQTFVIFFSSAYQWWQLEHAVM